jgi:signal transduction histidine kinase
LDIATKPDAVTRVRSKRSSTQRPEAKAHRGGPSHAPNGAGELDPHSGSVVELKEKLQRTERERARAAELLVQAKENLDTAHQRLVDADVARRHLLDNVASGGDEARRRFASVLHDDVLQQLTAAELQLERIRIEARRTKYAAPLDQLKSTMKQVEESLRNLLFNVSPATEDAHVHLADAVRDRLIALKTHTGIEPDVDLQLPKRIPVALKSIVFRNIAEAVSNVEKHANATRVGVKAEMVDGGLEVTVSDDGTGFVVGERLHLPGHLGLVAMRERAQLAGGWCRFESEPGAGTTVTFWAPIGL